MQGMVDGEVEVLPGRLGDPHRRPFEGPPGDRHPRHERKTLAFFGDLGMRPWSANPRWVTSFDDFPLNSVEVKGELFARAVEEGWLLALSHEPVTPIGRLTPDRDRYRFDPV